MKTAEIETLSTVDRKERRNRITDEIIHMITERDKLCKEGKWAEFHECSKEIKEDIRKKQEKLHKRQSEKRSRCKALMDGHQTAQEKIHAKAIHQERHAWKQGRFLETGRSSGRIP